MLDLSSRFSRLVFGAVAIAIGLFLLYSMIIENIVKSILNHYMDKPFGNFMPLQCSDELLPFPMLQMAKVVPWLESRMPL